MKDLIVKVKGAVEYSNLEEFKSSALGFIRNINTELVTDDDFAEASKNIKSCQKAEKLLEQKKADILGQTVDISKVISVIDEIKENIRKTRLDISKKEKNEKEKRKNQIVQNGVNALANIYAVSDVAFHLRNPDKSIVLEAVRGKKTIAGMDKAIIDLIESEKARVNQIVDNFHVNMALIGESEVQSLFHDREKLAMETESEVRAEIKSRESQYQLEQKEKEEAAKLEDEKLTLEKPLEKNEQKDVPFEIKHDDVPFEYDEDDNTKNKNFLITVEFSGSEASAEDMKSTIISITGVKCVKCVKLALEKG